MSHLAAVQTIAVRCSKNRQFGRLSMMQNVIELLSSMTQFHCVYKIPPDSHIYAMNDTNTLQLKTSYRKKYIFMAQP